MLSWPRKRHLADIKNIGKHCFSSVEYAKVKLYTKIQGTICLRCIIESAVRTVSCINKTWRWQTCSFVTKPLLHGTNLRTPVRIYITSSLALVILSLSFIIIKQHNFWEVFGILSDKIGMVNMHLLNLDHCFIFNYGVASILIQLMTFKTIRIIITQHDHSVQRVSDWLLTAMCPWDKTSYVLYVRHIPTLQKLLAFPRKIMLRWK